MDFRFIMVEADDRDFQSRFFKVFYPFSGEFVSGGKNEGHGSFIDGCDDVFQVIAQQRLSSGKTDYACPQILNVCDGFLKLIEREDILLGTIGKRTMPAIARAFGGNGEIGYDR
jgi:hypothetical protein